MKLKCKQFNSDLTIGKIYEVDENDPISYNLDNSHYIKNDQGKNGYYNSYLFVEVTAELTTIERDKKLKELGI
jgi:hypothetical protein